MAISPDAVVQGIALKLKTGPSAFALTVVVMAWSRRLLLWFARAVKTRTSSGFWQGECVRRNFNVLHARVMSCTRDKVAQSDFFNRRNTTKIVILSAAKDPLVFL